MSLLAIVIAQWVLWTQDAHWGWMVAICIAALLDHVAAQP